MLVYVRDARGGIIGGTIDNPTVIVNYDGAHYELPLREVQQTNQVDIWIVDDSLLNYENQVLPKDWIS